MINMKLMAVLFVLTLSPDGEFSAKPMFSKPMDMDLCLKKVEQLEKRNRNKRTTYSCRPEEPK